MNVVSMIGRLAKDVETRWTQGENPTCIARYSLAVDRRFKKDGGPTADFFNCVAFGKSGEFAEKYLRKGMKIGITGRLQNNNYEGQDGKMVYRDEIVVENHEFCESKKAEAETVPEVGGATKNDFMDVPDSIQEELPFL